MGQRPAGIELIMRKLMTIDMEAACYPVRRDQDVDGRAGTDVSKHEVARQKHAG